MIAIVARLLIERACQQQLGIVLAMLTTCQMLMDTSGTALLDGEVAVRIVTGGSALAGAEQVTR